MHYFVRFLCPVTFKFGLLNYGHTPAQKNARANFVFYAFFVSELIARVGQTDKQTYGQDA